MGNKVTVHLADATGVSTGEVQTIDTRTLADARAEAVARIEAEGAVRGSVCWVTVQGVAKPYQIDAGSRLNIAGAGADAVAVLTGVSGAIWPANFYWIAADNTQQPMTAADCFAFAQAVKVYYAGLIYAGRAMKDAVLALPDRESCDAFDATSGWPANP